MRLLATSDLHVSHAQNLTAVRAIAPAPDDWLIVAGDVGESTDDLITGLRTLTGRFRQVVWVPGNHELWTLRRDPLQLYGEERYRYLVEICRAMGVLTPEDPYPVLEIGDTRVVLAPLFLLYDYSFRPAGLSLEQAMETAYATGVVCTDEVLLDPRPFPDRAAWCRARVEETRRRLDAIPADLATVLVSHFPLTEQTALIPRLPLFSMWCGTSLTEDWPWRYRAAAVVYGHTHLPGSRVVRGVRFEEVSFGYPHERRGIAPPRPRQIVPAPPTAATERAVASGDAPHA
jgi:3',5'-cyclic AMP phosphodiesterase CpdA